MSKTIVITGSTKGLGLGMAEAFLSRGHNVVISGRRQDTVDETVAALKAPKRVIGIACDVADVAQVQNLWRQSAKVFGRIDIWINNAGLINKYRNIGALVTDDIASVVEANLSGTMNGTNIAAREMQAQDIVNGTRGAIYNFEGFGSDGMTRPGLSIYGATKRAITYFTAAAAKELRDKNIVAGYIQHGIAVTQLGLGDYWGKPIEEVRANRKIVMMLGDPVAPVAAFIADRVLANTKPGARINWLSPFKLLWRVLSHKFIKRDPIGASGIV
jgi:NAD(P)-dependent dehydrogenase (short-subunit alcohol dehydrogenase family)